jgi:hypothetical protein
MELRGLSPRGRARNLGSHPSPQKNHRTKAHKLYVKSHIYYFFGRQWVAISSDAIISAMKRRNAVLVGIVALSLIAVSNTVVRSDDQAAPTKTAGSTLKIVNDNLVKVDDGDCVGCLYAVKGSVYNPNNDGVKNVVVRYYIWKKWIGKDGHGSAIKETGGLVSATIKYLPPKQTVDFMATSHYAPVMTQKSGLVPDPISAEVTGEWDQ